MTATRPLKILAAGALLLPLLGSAAGRSASPANPIPAENARAGTTGWKALSLTRAIEGYASEVSVRPGETVHFHVSTNPPELYHIHVYRLGWYGGAGGREVACIPAACGQVAQGKAYPVPGPDANGKVDAGWPVTDELKIPENRVSGYYLARFELRSGEEDGRATAALFVVRAPPERRSPILVQVPVNTWEAYNPWGGKSLYDELSTGGRANRVSFARPLPLNYMQTLEWEIQLVRFLEREGYDVSYQTDVDTHRDPASLLAHRAVVVNGHDEYWTSTIRDAFEAARDQGTNLAFMGANIGYWQVRHEDGERTIFGEKAPNDLFRALMPPRPECDLLGVQYEEGKKSSGGAPRSYTVAAPTDPWFTGTGFTSSTVLPELVGPEWDVRACDKPGEVVLFHYDGTPSNADAVRYTAPSGGRVFSAGSLQLAWGLDDWLPPSRGLVYPAIPGLQQFLRNALADLQRPAPPLGVTGASGRGGVVLTVPRGPDPRVQAVEIRRDELVVCRIAAGACLDPDLPGHRAYAYAAVAIDDWGASEPAQLRVAIPNRPPSVSLRRAGRSLFVASASDADGDRLAYCWRLDGRRVAARGKRLVARLDPGRHLVEVTVSDGHGGRTTRRLRFSA